MLVNTTFAFPVKTHKYCCVEAEEIIYLVILKLDPIFA